MYVTIRPSKRGRKMTHTVVAGQRFPLKPRYKFTTFVLDCVLALLTGGLWFLWPAFKFLRTGHR